MACRTAGAHVATIAAKVEKALVAFNTYVRLLTTQPSHAAASGGL